LLGVVVKVGVEALGNLTEAGHEIVREPVPSCFTITVKLYASPEEGGFEIVSDVMLLFMVNSKMFAVARSSVCEVELMVEAVTSSR